MSIGVSTLSKINQEHALEPCEGLSNLLSELWKRERLMEIFCVNEYMLGVLTLSFKVGKGWALLDINSTSSLRTISFMLGELHMCYPIKEYCWLVSDTCKRKLKNCGRKYFLRQNRAPSLKNSYMNKNNELMN